jgi:hypothetical protein
MLVIGHDVWVLTHCFLLAQLNWAISMPQRIRQILGERRLIPAIQPLLFRLGLESWIQRGNHVAQTLVAITIHRTP